MKFNTPEEYANYAEQLFYQGFNCSQCLLLTFSDFTNIDDELAAMISSPFGGGMGRLREVCGAVSGMFMVLGILEGYSKVEENHKKAELYEKVQNLATTFKDNNGSIICRDLLGLKDLKDGKDSPIPEARTKEYYESRPCPKKIANGAYILADYLLNKEM